MMSKVSRGNKKQMAQVSFFQMVCPMRPSQPQANVILPLLLPFHLFGTEHPFLFSHLLRNLNKAIASLPLGPHIVRNYTFNSPLHSHTVACLFCDDRRVQLKIQRIFEDRLRLLWLSAETEFDGGSFVENEAIEPFMFLLFYLNNICIFALWGKCRLTVNTVQQTVCFC